MPDDLTTDKSQKQIPIADGISAIADRKAGAGWIEAWHIIEQALHRQKNNRKSGGMKND